MKRDERECREISGLFATYLDGEATPEERASVEAHISGCPECRAEIDELSALQSSLRSALDTAAEEVLPSTRIWQQVKDRLGFGESFSEKLSRLLSSGILWRYVAAAAVILIIVAAAFVWQFARFGGMASEEMQEEEEEEQEQEEEEIIIEEEEEEREEIEQGASGRSEAFRPDFPILADAPGDAEFELSAGLPTVEWPVTVYRVRQTEVTIDSVIELGRKLGFEGDAGYIERDTKIAMLDESGDEIRQLKVWVDSGAIDYAIVSPDKLYQPAPDLPSKEEAKEIALQFLTDNGLLPDDAAIADTEVVIGGSFSEITKKEDGTIAVKEEISHWLVSIPRQINGLPAAKSGGNTLAVRIGDRGEVVSVFKLWRAVEPYFDVVNETSPQQAYQKLISGAGNRYAPAYCEKVVIEEVYLAYWMETPDSKQEYTVPVYEFRGKCLDENGNITDSYTGWIEVLR